MAVIEKDQIILRLLDRLEASNRLILDFKEEIKSLKARLSKFENPKNSNNSSIPPSQDRFRKTQSSRKPSSKKVGGQIGHKGSRLKMTEHPDKVVLHDIKNCGCCGEKLTAAGERTSRQVFDLPEIKMIVTEHITVSKTCTGCGAENTSKFPEALFQEAQYGDRIKALCVYLQNYQMLPFERCAEFIEDLVGQKISQGSLANFQKSAYTKLQGYEQQIIQLLLHSSVNHADETGVKLHGKNTWMHVLSNQAMTFFGHHIKRGKEAINSFNIIPRYKGTLIHDRFSSYFSYNCQHGLCNAHILRELKYIGEAFDAAWSEKMSKLLIRAHGQKKKKGHCSKKYYDRILEEYQKLIDPIIDNYNDKFTKTDEQRLAFGLKKHRSLFLKFIEHREIPFDNNLAERDLRMIKVKQKISGTFRSTNHAQYFARIRGYISTVKKNQQNVLHSLAMAFQNRPFIPGLGE